MNAESASTTEAVPLLVPLLFIVLLEFCRVARDINLREAAEGNAWIFPETIEVPGFGLFVIIHGFNYIMLLSLFGWVSSLYDGNLLFAILTGQYGDIYLLLGIFTVVIWLALPILEVSEYHQVSVADGGYPIPDSYVLYIKATGFNIVLVIVISWLRKLPPKPDRGGIMTVLSYVFQSYNSQPIVAIFSVLLGVVLIFSLAIAILGFAGNLEEEISKQADQHRLYEFGL